MDAKESERSLVAPGHARMLLDFHASQRLGEPMFAPSRRAALTACALAWLAAVAVAPAADPDPVPRLDVSREVETLIPKRETGVPEFLKQHPTYDGRGVVIAIFDTGVDPGAAGLQTTTTGEPKVVDIIDGTGAGDVDTSTTAKRREDGMLVGRTGRTLRLPDGLGNTNDTFFIGMKPAEHLFHDGVLARIKEERRQDWERHRRELTVERKRREQADEKIGRRPPATKAEADLTLAERDALARESLLENLEKNFDGYEPGPVYDCVVWHDGEHWNVLVDTDEDGDLRDEKRLRPFGVAREYAGFGPRVGCHFGVQVYEEGRRLSLVTVSGSHGTHVAAIASAHFPDEPARNGIAPGARILSIKIGDVRLDGSSSGVGEMRAVAACAKYKADVMNASWGGASVFQDGRSLNCQLYTRLAEEYGIVPFVSVGNSGPALSTLGSPGGETLAVIGVGAYVSKDMSRALYAVNGDTTDTAFHFTSRGPAKGGYLGVDIMGPGAATASVSYDTLTRAQRMNGTSMSSPSLAGLGALLVSAARQLKIPVTPPRIKAALVNGARRIEGVEPWAQGAGLAQIGPAFEHLQRAKDIPAYDYEFDVRTDDNPLQAGPGLYWRNGRPPGDHEVQFSVSPRFPGGASADQKFNFEHDLVLQATAPWIRLPRYLHLTAGAQTFRPVLTVPATPATGSAPPLYAEIHGLLASRPEAGPLFRIPITIVQPQRPDGRRVPADAFEAKLDAGDLDRRFYLVPADVTHVRLRLRRNGGELNARQYMIHALSLASTRAFSAEEFKTQVRLEPGEEYDAWFEVLPGRTVELVLHQLWSSLGASTLQAELEFHGLHAAQAAVHFGPNQKYATLDLISTVGDLNVEVSARLTSAVYRHLPKEWSVTPLDDRDALPPGPLESGPVRPFALRQRFEFTLERAGTYSILTDRFPAVDEDLAGGLMTVFHESGRLLWQGGRSRRGGGVLLPKGRIIVHREMRALDSQMLEREKDRPLVLQRELTSAPTLAVAEDGPGALRGRSAGRVGMKQGRDYSFHLQNASLPALKDLTPVPAYFTGEVRVNRGSNTLLRLPLTYLRGEDLVDPKRPAGGEVKPTNAPVLVKLNQDVFDKKLETLRTLRHKQDKEAAAARRELLAELKAQKPDLAALSFEEAIAIASRQKLLSRWHTTLPSEEKPETPRPAAAAEEAAPDSPVRRGRRRPAGDVTDSISTTAAPAVPAEPRDGTKPPEDPAPGQGKDSKPAAPGEAKPVSAEARKDEDAAGSNESGQDGPGPEAIFAALDEALRRTEADAVARFFGAPPAPPPEDAAARAVVERERKERTTQRDFLRDTWLLRADVLLHQDKLKEARLALLESRRWEALPATPSRKSREQELALLEKEGHLGLALQLLDEQFLKEEPANRKLREQRASLYRKLGWTTWADREDYLLLLDKHQPQPAL